MAGITSDYVFIVNWQGPLCGAEVLGDQKRIVQLAPMCHIVPCTIMDDGERLPFLWLNVVLVIVKCEDNNSVI